MSLHPLFSEDIFIVKYYLSLKLLSQKWFFLFLILVGSNCLFFPARFLVSGSPVKKVMVRNNHVYVWGLSTWSPVTGPGGHMNKLSHSESSSEVLKLSQRIWLVFSGKELETRSLLADSSRGCVLRSRKHCF